MDGEEEGAEEGVRWDLVRRARRRIALGSYELEEVWEETARRIAGRLEAEAD